MPKLVTRSLGLVLALACSQAAQAHDRAIDLNFWGDFGRATARCQQIVSRATAACTRVALDVRDSCLMVQLAGDECDTAATEARIEVARAEARNQVERHCTDAQLRELQYLSLQDALDDLTRVCEQIDTAVMSASFGPATVGGTVGAAASPMSDCLEVTSDGTRTLMRSAIRVQQRAFDRIASRSLTTTQKRALVDWSKRRIEALRSLVRRRIEARCPDSMFQSVYGRGLDGFLTGIAQQSDCFSGSVYVQDAVTCPAPVCGNGIQERNEECDDGNDFEGDGCRSDCTKVSCDSFASTYDLIQRAIFENRGCTEAACHGSAQSGGLDLRPEVSYENLIDVVSPMLPTFKRVDPGNKDNSLLWINVAAKTLPQEWQAPIRAMPVSEDALTLDELEALRIWIETGGASRTATVAGVSELLDGCVPEPRPVEITPLPPPPPGQGVQMHMPVWDVSPRSESEVCFASYYDFTGQIPPEFLSADGTRFRYKRVDIRQDPLSHHLIVDLYRGSEPADHPSWGTYSCKQGPRHGQTCDPFDLEFCGEGGDCATDPDPTAIACIGFGPQTGLSTLTNGGFAFAQETAAEFRFPPGVYDEIPIKGVALWNSHVFNLTRFPGKMEAWVNVIFPEPEEQQHQQIQIFNAQKIFWNESFPPFPLPELAPFERTEVCHVHVFGREGEVFYGSAVKPEETVHLFELSGHTHERGKRFQIFRGSFTCKGGSLNGKPCAPLSEGACRGGGVCTDDGGRDPQESLLYSSFVYNDPVVLRLDPPILISGSVPKADRSLTYCAVYDNGAAPNLHWVKRRSTSPPAGTIFGIPIGGPCTAARTRCIGGPQHNQLCNGNHAVCESSPGAGDGDCDACPLTGGFRTTDEMFILFGNFWLE
jgi:cysteine-rich repeat protein